MTESDLDEALRFMAAVSDMGDWHRANIAEHGYSLCSVFPTGDDPDGYGFTYTIGGADRWGYDVVLVNSVDGSGIWLQLLDRSLQHPSVQPARPGEPARRFDASLPFVDDGHDDVEPLWCSVEVVPDWWVDANYTQHAMAGIEPAGLVVQVVLGDQQGRHLDDPGFEGAQFRIADIGCNDSAGT